MPLRQFRDKYNGDIKAALRGLQMEKLGLNKDGDDSFDENDNTRKRKWIVSVEAEASAHVHGGSGSGSSEAEAARASKNGESSVLLITAVLKSLKY
jgi:hypothetical protein